jgi:hypothetical protein
VTSWEKISPTKHTKEHKEKHRGIGKKTTQGSRKHSFTPENKTGFSTEKVGQVESGFDDFGYYL